HCPGVTDGGSLRRRRAFSIHRSPFRRKCPGDEPIGTDRFGPVSPAPGCLGLRRYRDRQSADGSPAHSGGGLDHLGNRRGWIRRSPRRGFAGMAMRIGRHGMDFAARGGLSADRRFVGAAGGAGAAGEPIIACPEERIMKPSRRRGGFAMIMALMLMGMVALTIAAFGVAITSEARRTAMLADQAQ